MESQNFTDHFLRFPSALVILILICNSLMCHRRVDASRHTYLFNNFPREMARRGDRITSNVDAAPYESQSVIVRKYHIVSIRIRRRRKEIFGVIFQSAGVPTLCTYVSSDRGPQMDNRWGGGRRGKRWRRTAEAIFYRYQLLLRETFRTSLKGGVFVVLSVMRDVISGIFIGLRRNTVLGIVCVAMVLVRRLS